MRVLPDTHVLLWALFQHQRLSGPAAAAIADTSNVVFASAVSPYELEWKRAIGKLKLPEVFDWRHAFRVSGYEPLSLSVEHAQFAARLPIHHRDPWDRLIVAQAGIETMTLITRDERMSAYGVPALW